MPRQKCLRQTFYQPLCTRFTPKNVTHNESIMLLSEETEALYWMDLMGLYQEDAAQKMGISRPTFARIIKSAHYKVALALLGGHHLDLETKRDRYVVALCCDSPKTLLPLQPKGKYVIIATIHDHTIVSWVELENPVFAQNLKPPLVLPELFQNHQVNFFISEKLGEGLRSALSARGIHIIQKTVVDKEVLAHLFD
ncbi:MAG: DUF134 domain-containing protein [Sulfurospirillum cavolei]|uniref:DUF134 domain-containing protein n=1 Tax=Sulfurospirillum sp. MES TaxID=1565314 RepID=UPI0005425EF3|nr:DUF134 domain-containing protein [Sulfurospirillum sp. MES]KHG34039.1 MAG: DNA-binding protein [Sulfurospirillum sp. MES]MCD8544592.1 DUF134 domain-containing protein [Sulfurospirillum cavolei]